METDLTRRIGEKKLGRMPMDLMSHVHQNIQRVIVPLSELRSGIYFTHN